MTPWSPTPFTPIPSPPPTFPVWAASRSFVTGLDAAWFSQCVITILGRTIFDVTPTTLTTPSIKAVLLYLLLLLLYFLFLTLYLHCHFLYLPLLLHFVFFLLFVYFFHLFFFSSSTSSSVTSFLSISSMSSPLLLSYLPFFLYFLLHLLPLYLPPALFLLNISFLRYLSSSFSFSSMSLSGQHLPIPPSPPSSHTYIFLIPRCLTPEPYRDALHDHRP